MEDKDKCKSYLEHPQSHGCLYPPEEIFRLQVAFFMDAGITKRASGVKEIKNSELLPKLVMVFSTVPEFCQHQLNYYSWESFSMASMIGLQWEIYMLKLGIANQMKF
jgi:hypothetical protein